MALPLPKPEETEDLDPKFTGSGFLSGYPNRGAGLAFSSFGFSATGAPKADFLGVPKVSAGF